MHNILNPTPNQHFKKQISTTKSSLGDRQNIIHSNILINRSINQKTTQVNRAFIKNSTTIGVSSNNDTFKTQEQMSPNELEQKIYKNVKKMIHSHLNQSDLVQRIQAVEIRLKQLDSILR